MIKYKCKSLFHFISSTLLLNNINEEWRKMKMNVKNSSQNTVKKYEKLTFTDDFMFCKVMQNNPDLCKHLIELIIGKKITKCRCKAPCFSNGDIRRLNQKNV